jgi:hypothetical protein
MMKKLLLLTLFFLTIYFSNAQTARDVAVETYAEAKAGGGVYIKWIPDNTAVKYYIFKRLDSKIDWLLLDSVSGSVNSYLDNGLLLGQIAEYRVSKSKKTFSFYANGYLLTGFEVAPKLNLGKVLMVIDSNYSVPLKSKIAEYKDQLSREGYTVISKVVLRTEKVSNIKSWIYNQWQSDSFNIKSIFLLGHVPVPYSGNYRPDGHTEHTGAWPADLYYGNFYSNWSDNTVNNTQATRSENQNVPSDGKFDISRVNPVGTAFSAIQRCQIPVGRVDLYGMPSFGNDTFLTKRYLNKALDFRRGVYKAAPRGLVDDNFGYFNSEAFASGGFRNFSVQFKDSVFERDYRTSMSKNSYLLSYGCGSGTYTSCDQVASTSTFATDSLLNPFTMTFGSYYGDWDNSDNFLRAPLASKGWGLVSVWSGRPYWMLHECALGLPLGRATLTTVNSYYYYNAAEFQSGVHTALMGDPTLTLYPLASLNNTKAIAKCTDKVRFRWDLHASNVDSIVIEEYIAGSWKRLTKTVGSDTDITYRASVGNHKYSIRPLKLMKSASGSWWQYGARQYCEVSVNVRAVAIAITSTNKACSVDSVIVAELKFGPNPKYTRSWYVNGKINPDTAVSFKRTYPVGNVNVLMKLTTDSGCVYNDSVKFVINSTPTAKTRLITAKNLCMNQKFIAKTESNGTQIWTIEKDTVSKIDSVKFTASAVGKYILKHKVIDLNGCFDVSQDTLLFNSLPNATFTTNPDTTICAGGKYAYNANDTTNNLIWNCKRNGAGTDIVYKDQKSVDVFSDVFSVKLIAKSIFGCSDSSLKFVNFYGKPQLPKIAIMKAATYPGDTISVKVMPNATYPNPNAVVWTKPFSSSDSILKFRVADTGTLNFMVYFVSDHGCISDTAYFNQYFGLSEFKNLEMQKIMAYPNPNTGRFTILVNSEVESVNIFDLKGQKIASNWKESALKNQLEMELKNIRSGIYLIQGQYKNGVKFVSKFEIL